MCNSNLQGPVVRKMDSTIHWINHYPLDSAIDFPNTYLLDNDLHPVDSAIQRLNNRGLEIRIAGSSVPRNEWSQNTNV